LDALISPTLFSTSCEEEVVRAGALTNVTSVDTHASVALSLVGEAMGDGRWSRDLAWFSLPSDNAIRDVAATEGPRRQATRNSERGEIETIEMPGCRPP
jgi:hypothetical protein